MINENEYAYRHAVGKEMHKLLNSQCRINRQKFSRRNSCLIMNMYIKKFTYHQLILMDATNDYIYKNHYLLTNSFWFLDTHTDN